LHTQRCICYIFCVCRSYIFFFFTAPSTTEIYTLSLHDALPISVLLDLGERGAQHVGDGQRGGPGAGAGLPGEHEEAFGVAAHTGDRKSTRLNSSHVSISYAVFCLKKKKKTNKNNRVHNITRKDT